MGLAVAVAPSEGRARGAPTATLDAHGDPPQSQTDYRVPAYTNTCCTAHATRQLLTRSAQRVQSRIRNVCFMYVASENEMYVLMHM